MNNKTTKTNTSIADSISDAVKQSQDHAVSIVDKPAAFQYEFDVFLKDTNAFGSVYFARQFEWQGLLREAWLSQTILPFLLQIGATLVTKTAHIDYIAPGMPFTKVVGTLTIKEIKNVSAVIELSFHDKETQQLISKGYQRIVLMDKNKKPLKVPDEIKFKLLQ